MPIYSYIDDDTGEIYDIVQGMNDVHEYYHNDILFDNTICKTVYINYAENIHVNKEKSYGIIWHTKCACSTIRTYFCNINNIKIALT